MEQAITQIAGLTKEVAVAYIVLYGIIEIGKLGICAFLGYCGINAIKELFKVFQI